MNGNALPKFLQDLIEHPPAAGSGVHDWIFDVARNLHAHWPATQIENLIRAKLVHCGRPVPDREIRSGIKNAVDYAWHPKGDGAGLSVTPRPNRPEANLEKIESLIRGGMRYADLWEKSPMWFKTPATEEIVDRLFPGNPLLCCGLSAAQFYTRTRENWRTHLEHQQFIVPSPQKALLGTTQEGRASAHCNNNTGPRRFLVIEFDFSEYGRDGKTETKYATLIRSLARSRITVNDMCAALLLLLDKFRPMTLAVHSGGKSLHGWWFVQNQSDDQTRHFFNYAITIGADPRTFVPCQFIRMPDGTRDNGKRQSVLYFDPATLP